MTLSVGAQQHTSALFTLLYTYRASLALAFTLLRILLLPVDDGHPARQHVVVQELWFLINLAITASTEECYPKVLPHMAEGSGHFLIHYPTVGAEGDLLPLVGAIRDGDLVQTLGLVEFVDHILPLILEVHLREYHCDRRTSLILV